MEINTSRMMCLVKSGFPLMLSGTFVLLNMQIDMVMLGLFFDKTAVGIYAAATRLSQVWYFFPVVVGISIMKSLVETREANHQEYQWKLQRVYDALSLLGIALAIFVTVFNELIIDLVFGVDYKLSALILQIHIWGILFVFHVSIRTRAWTIEGKEKLVGIFAFTTAIINILLNLVLIPKFAGVGAALASVVSWGMAVVLLPILMKQSLKSSRMFWRSLVFPTFWQRKQICQLRLIQKKSRYL